MFWAGRWNLFKSGQITNNRHFFLSLVRLEPTICNLLLQVFLFNMYLFLCSQNHQFLLKLTDVQISLRSSFLYWVFQRIAIPERKFCDRVKISKGASDLNYLSGWYFFDRESSVWRLKCQLSWRFCIISIWKINAHDIL